ncbi:MAG: response regulator [Elusimicrobia bacterium]|nr:response regulator [Elusimicrobiota bacterium]
MPRILLIEDEPQHAALVKMRLEANGMQVSCSRTAAAGVASAQKDRPDLVLLDLLLPDMRPEEAVKAITRAADSPILAFTALDLAEIHRRRLDTQVAGIVTKPYDPAVLVSEILRLTRK